MFKHFRVVLRITPRDIGRAFKAAGRFLLRILPALVFFSSLMFTYSAPVYASTSGGLVETKPTVGTLVKSQQYSYKLYKDLFNDFVDAIDQNSRRLQKISFLNRMYYFSLMLDNSLNCSSDISSGNTFTNDYLWFYFDFYMSHVNWSDNSSIAFFTVANDDGIITDVDDLKFDIEKLSFFPSNWNGRLIHWTLSDPPEYFSDFKNFFNYLYNVYITEGSLSPGELTGIADPIFSASDFKDHIKTTNAWYYPKNTTDRISYRTDEFYKTSSGRGLNGDLTLYTLDGGFCNAGLGYDREVWLCPFYTNGTDTYYGQEQIHIYLELSTDDDGNSCTFVKFDMYNVFNNPSEPQLMGNYTFTNLYSPSFLLIQFDYGNCEIYSYTSRSDFLSRKNGSLSKGYFNFSYDLYSVTNAQKSYRYDSSQKYVHFFWNTWESHDGFCSYGALEDIGYIFSNKMIEFNYSIDVPQIPNNYYITVSGDTIYDYSITNPETGQKDTIRNFITNNYTFTTNNNGDTNIDNGNHNTSIAGSGNGGNGDVNVNVTVNNNIGGGGGSYDMPDTSFFDDYLDDALKESSGIRKFIADFFDSMPGQITKLICIGLVLAILCRLIGR